MEKRRKGRQKKNRLEDNIKEWKGMVFLSFIMAAKTGQDGKGL